MYSMNTPSSSPCVDTHFHIFDAGVAIQGARYVPAYAATLDQWWALAGAAGVTHGVLVQPSFLGTDNRLMLEGLAACPGRLVGIAVVEPTITAQELTQMHAVGVRGIRFNLVRGDHRLDDYNLNAVFWDYLIAQGWHVEIHTDPGRLPEVLPQLPTGLRVVVDHMAKPLQALPSDPTLQILHRYGEDRVMVKLSGAYRQAGADAGDLAQALLGELGSSALVWGSDWPCTNHERSADYPSLRSSLTRWVGEKHSDEIMSLNPMRLYWGRQPNDLIAEPKEYELTSLTTANRTSSNPLRSKPA
jgi:predicted TIM-barrel fold metal-dependent hydrolase